MKKNIFAQTIKKCISLDIKKSTHNEHTTAIMSDPNRQLSLHQERLEDYVLQLIDAKVILKRARQAIHNTPSRPQHLVDAAQRAHDNVLNLIDTIKNLEEQISALQYQTPFQERTLKRSHSSEFERAETTNQDNIVMGRRQRTQTTHYSPCGMIETPTHTENLRRQGDFKMLAWERAQRGYM